MIRVKKLATHRDRSDLNDAKADLERLREITDDAPETFSSCVEAFVQEFFEKSDKKLIILSVKGIFEINKKDAGMAKDWGLHVMKNPSFTLALVRKKKPFHLPLLLVFSLNNRMMLWLA